MKAGEVWDLSPIAHSVGPLGFVDYPQPHSLYEWRSIEDVLDVSVGKSWEEAEEKYVKLGFGKMSLRKLNILANLLTLIFEVSGASFNGSHWMMSSVTWK